MKPTSDFEQQWQRRRHEAHTSQCPLSEEALDTAIDRAMHTATTRASQPLRPTTRPLWLRTVAAAAVLAAIAIPSTRWVLRDNTPAGTVRSVNIGNQHVRFVCNNGCSAEGIVSMFDRQIHQS